MFQFLLRYTTAALLLLSLPTTAPAQPDEHLVRFYEEVLFLPEFTSTPQRYCKLWTTAPKLSVFGNGDLHPRVIENVVKQLNDCLPTELQIEILENQSPAATLAVHFIPSTEFESVASANDFRVIENNWGIFYSRWNSDFEIKKSVILIATDKLSGARLNHFVLEEITQALGFPGDSNRHEKSVFFEDTRRAKFGRTTVLSKVDRDLIRFHYRFNRPGDTPVEFGIKLAKHW